MARDVDILDYLPPVLKEVKELVEIANIENPVLSDLWQQIEDVLNDQFIVTATEKGSTRYEKMLKINVPASDDLETRRFRLLTRFREQSPYTWKVLHQLLDSLLGEEHYELTRNATEKWIKVKLELTVKGQFEAVELMLERITPQNMLLTVELRYNQHITLANFTHQQLSSLTHQQLREEVIS